MIQLVIVSDGVLELKNMSLMRCLETIRWKKTNFKILTQKKVFILAAKKWTEKKKKKGSP